MQFTFQNEEHVRKIVREEMAHELKKATRLLPTKNEFFNKMDEVVGEIKDMREEITCIQGQKDQLEELQERMDNIEVKLIKN